MDKRDLDRIRLILRGIMILGLIRSREMNFIIFSLFEMSISIQEILVIGDITVMRPGILFFFSKIWCIIFKKFKPIIDELKSFVIKIPRRIAFHAFKDNS